MRLIGITGSLGAGKSTVLGLFARLGAAGWDADAAVHELYQPGRAGWRAARDRWGEEILAADGQLDRARLAARIFPCPAERKRWEAIIHPLVHDHMLATAQAAAAPLFCAVPLLYEGGWESWFEAVACVWCPPALQRERLRRRGLAEADISARLAAQLPADEKLRRADFGLINAGSLDLLARQCAAIWNRLTQP
ncbi:MAG: dephospho-CoA kinase [Lentisphaeria bacterium]|jgi:dephospho-CoA kinase